MTHGQERSFAKWKDRLLWVMLLAWAGYVTTGAAMAYSLKDDLDFIKAYIIKQVGGRTDR